MGDLPTSDEASNAQQQQLRLLCLAVRVPVPADDGESMRVTGLLRSLSTRHHVDVASVRRSATSAGHVRELDALVSGESIVFSAPRSARTNRMAASWRWTIAVLQGEPPWARAHRHHDFGRFLETHVDRYDAVVCLDNAVTINLRGVALQVPVIVDIHNIEGWSVRRLRAQASGFTRRLHAFLSIWLTQRSERRSIKRMDGIVVTSEDEAQRLHELYGTTADEAIPSGTDLPRRPLRAAGAGTVGWIGGHNYEPNRDGLVGFVHNGWRPLGRAGYRLLIAGADPPPEVASLSNITGVEVLGYVDDLEAFLAQIDVAVVPLWVGAGVKLKTVTFLGSGIPLVSTIIGFEGTGVVDGVHGFVRESPEDIAAALHNLLTDPDLAERIGSNGRDLVARELTWESVGSDFVDAVEKLAGCRR